MVDSPAGDPRSGRRVRGWLGALLAHELGALGGWAPLDVATHAPEDFDVSTAELLAVKTTATVAEAAPDLEKRYPLPMLHGQRIDEIYPSLTGWTHPVVNTDLVLPELPMGYFGADRDGVKHHRECGAGHCGDDISGPIGRPVVAVQGGVVVHVDRSRLGKDKRSGRYVRIEHDDGVITAYMHLNSITAGLDVGDRVEGGQQIGTLGNTAVYSAPPHLHFAVELPNVQGTHGDHQNTHYIDPSPFLVRATVAHAADRRRSKKPSL